MQTMDAIITAPDGALSSPAVARNTGPILEVLRAHLPTKGRVLEIAAGSGEHAVAFARVLSGLTWTPSDPSPDARASIAAWAAVASLPNVLPPLDLDVLDAATWPQADFHALICINMVHISPWAATLGLFRLAQATLVQPGGLLVLYGPYRESDRPLAPSNAAFDDSLKARNVDWGLRDLDEVVAVARDAGLRLTLRHDMPANNLMLLFRRVP